MNIKQLLEDDGFSCKKIAKTYGGTYGSPCPWCGGDDRFRSFPNNNDSGGNWLCQKCGRTGTAITYLIERRGMSYNEACLYLGLSTKRQSGSLRKKITDNLGQLQPKVKDDLPTEQWRSGVNTIIKGADKILWNLNPKVISWLNDRGLKDETIKKFKLGFFYQDQLHKREDLGLPPNYKENGEPKKLWVPRGLIIPYIFNEKIIRLRVRRFDFETDPKYILLEGSSNKPMIIDSANPVVIVESELDAMLIHQEAGDLITVIALGSSQIRPDKATIKLLKQAEVILISSDSDEAGVNSFKWWEESFPKSIFWPVPKGKDPSEARQKGVNIRDWIEAGLSYKSDDHQSIIVEDENEMMVESDSFDDPEAVAFKLRGLKDATSIIINLMTTGNDPFSDEIKAIQFYGSNDILLSLDYRSLSKDNHRFLKELLEINSNKVFHDAKPQLKFLQDAGFSISGQIFDTLLAAQLLEAGLKKRNYDLESLSERYLSGTCFNPVEKIKQLTNTLIDELKKNSLEEAAALEFKVLSAVVGMETSGILLDGEKWNLLGAEIGEKKEKLENHLYAELGELNLNSTEQLLSALSAKGINVPDTNKETLAAYSNRHPVLTQIMEYRKVAKLLQSYIIPIPKFVNSRTGRIHAEYNQLGADTGRFSCQKPNLQGIPKDKSFRSCFVAAPGNVLIRADYSQIELRIAAEITGDNKMIEAFSKGDDLHRLTASIISGKPMDQIGKEERQAAKAVNFGLIFAMGAKRLMNYAKNKYGVTMTLDQAENFRNKYFASYSGIKRWHDQVQNSNSWETRTLGNRRKKWERQPKFTMLLNSPVQGTGADLLKRALCLIYEKLDKIESKLIACVHDEIILETPENREEDAAGILKKTMIEAGKYNLKKVPVEVEVSTGSSWAD